MLTERLPEQCTDALYDFLYQPLPHEDPVRRIQPDAMLIPLLETDTIDYWIQAWANMMGTAETLPHQQANWDSVFDG